MLAAVPWAGGGACPARSEGGRTRYRRLPKYLDRSLTPRSPPASISTAKRDDGQPAGRICTNRTPLAERSSVTMTDAEWTTATSEISISVSVQATSQPGFVAPPAGGVPSTTHHRLPVVRHEDDLGAVRTERRTRITKRPRSDLSHIGSGGVRDEDVRCGCPPNRYSCVLRLRWIRISGKHDLCASHVERRL